MSPKIRLFGLTCCVIFLITACVSTEPLRGTALGETAVIRMDDGQFNCAPTGQEPTRFDAPEQVILSTAHYLATITMDNNEQVDIALYTESAPTAVNSFVFLACQGFYDGVTFHRVIPDFVAQSGDPSGTGRGDPGYTILGEGLNGKVFDRAGLVGMAHSGHPDSAGSQFFITYGPTPSLDGRFTIFGEVIAGMAVIDTLTPRDPEKAVQDGAVIRQIRIEEIQG
ncbi:peptidylprolyl isomerase [Chloroflexota bacterium]